MTTEHPASDRVTIEALTAAVAHVLLYRSAHLSVQLHNAIGFTAAERDAWMVAFKWRDKFGPTSRLDDTQLAEFNAGIQLIRNLS